MTIAHSGKLVNHMPADSRISMPPSHKYQAVQSCACLLGSLSDYRLQIVKYKLICRWQQHQQQLSKRHSPDSIVVDGSNVCHKNLHIFLWLNFRLIPHEPVLLIAGDDIDDNAIGLTNSSLHHRKTLKLE